LRKYLNQQIAGEKLSPPIMHRALNPAQNDPGAHGRCALAVMTKAPRRGMVKTRLVPPLTDEEAAQLNIQFLRDTAAAISEVSKRSSASAVAVYTPAGSEAAYAGILPPDFQLLLQRGELLGDRLVFAVEDLFQNGFASVCLIGSDSPTVPTEAYAQAVSELAQPGDRIVIGPSDDGGYYLIGLKQVHRRMFEEIDWSTERVLEQTKQRARELSLELSLLPSGYDVDDRAALQRLCDELLRGDRPGDIAPNTRRFLVQLNKHAKL
jgi:uncharacterized protein